MCTHKHASPAHEYGCKWIMCSFQLKTIIYTSRLIPFFSFLLHWEYQLGAVETPDKSNFGLNKSNGKRAWPKSTQKSWHGTFFDEGKSGLVTPLHSMENRRERRKNKGKASEKEHHCSKMAIIAITDWWQWRRKSKPMPTMDTRRVTALRYAIL